jgi:hypothetical protein
LKLLEVQLILQAEAICCAEFLDREVETVCGADLMSDVLAFTKENTLLLTGLTNIQVIRTADMSDLAGIVFVRGKRPNPELIQLAEVKSIPLFVSDCSMYEACGRLYQKGLLSCPQSGNDDE